MAKLIYGDSNFLGKIGMDVSSPTEKLEINGAIKLGTASGTADGTIRWTGSDFEGRKSSSWVSLTSAGGGSPGGSDTQIQYNNGGSFGGCAQLYWDDSNNRLGINIAAPAAKLHAVESNATNASLTWGAAAGQIFRNENSELALGLEDTSPYPFYIQGRTSSSTARDIVINPLGGAVGIGTGTSALNTIFSVAGEAYFYTSTNWNYAGVHVRRTDTNDQSNGFKLQSFMLGGDSLSDTNMYAYWNFSSYRGNGLPGPSTASDSTTEFRLQGPGPFLLGVASAVRLRVTTDGYFGFGLGATAPINLADVRGNMAVGTYAGVNTAPANGLIISGSTGVGTASPGGKLHVVGTSFPVLFAEYSSSDTSVVNTSLKIQHTTSGNMLDGFGSAAAFFIRDSAGVDNHIASINAVRTGGDTTSDLLFATALSGSVDERFRISSTGSIKAVCSYSTNVSLTWGAAAGQIFRNENSEFAFGLEDTDPYPLYIQGRTSANAARNIVINPLGGYVGIGTTSPQYVLHVTSAGLTGYFNTTSSTTDHCAVKGVASQTTGVTYGLFGVTNSVTAGAAGIYGAASGAGSVRGVHGTTASASSNSIGVLGTATYGVGGYFDSTSGLALYTGTGNVQISNNLGLGATPNAVTGLYLAKTFNSATAVTYGAIVEVTQSVADATYAKYGLLTSFNVSHTSGTLAAIVGTHCRVYVSGSGGTVSNTYGSITGYAISAGTTDNGYGLIIDRAQSGGSVTYDSMGLRISDHAYSAGTKRPAVNYGLYIDTQAGGTANYAMYINGLSHMAGKLTLLTSRSSDYVATFRNTYGDNTAWGIAISCGKDVTKGSGDANGDCTWVGLFDNAGFTPDTDNWLSRIEYTTSAPYARFLASSDARQKKNIRPTEIKALPLIRGLEMMAFDWKTKKLPSQKIGYIAQQVMNIIPELVSYDSKSDEYGVGDSILVKYLVKAIQELADQVDVLKSQLSAC